MEFGKIDLDQRVKIDSDAVRSLAELLRETDLTEIEYQVDSLRIKVSRAVQQAVIPVQTSSQQAPSSPNQDQTPAVAASGTTKLGNWENHPGIVEAQMVGTVYLSPGPDASPFVSVGESVSQGQTLFVIEAMKVMNMIKAPRSGMVKYIFVRDAQPVEYGDPIIVIE
ncbi:MAG: acetyl-CoA carboxylase biotin carboxyl carrier protein [Holosporaceae bacterium]|nr:acetyl-CoA carboxylase biotin carboxyl carrier protein [Holosporaceae bacterium]